jgi:hypothetical protein
MVPQTAPVTRQQNEGTGLRLSADARPEQTPDSGPYALESSLPAPGTPLR